MTRALRLMRELLLRPEAEWDAIVREKDGAVAALARFVVALVANLLAPALISALAGS